MRDARPWHSVPAPVPALAPAPAMSALALALVLTSALLHATWNLAAKRAGGATRGPAFVFAFSSATAVLYAPFALSAGGARVADVAPIGWAFVVGSAVLHVGYFVALQRGYRVGDLSIVYPLARGVGPALATVGAVALLGERPSVLALLGTLLVVAAAVALATGRPRPGARIGPGVRWGLVTAVFIAAYTLWDAVAVARVGVPPLLYLWWSELVRATLLAPAALRRPEALRHVWVHHLGAVATVALLSPLAYLLVLTAFTLAPVSLVAPTREVSVLIGALFGTALLGEGNRVRRLTAAAAMVVGVALLARG
jgi:drug/metabolite transporter (DMT)-like permease